MFTLYNSLTKKIERFKPLNPPVVTLYTCGPTVYFYPHIGHGRKYVMDDILKRSLVASGYSVIHVQNITDVGHLVSDADEGEDKLEKGARREKKTVWEVARLYEREFNNDMALLNIIPPDHQPRATEHVNEQIDMVKLLLEKGHAYDTKEAVYFDISTYTEYGTLFSQSLDEKEIAVRDSVKTGKYKKHPADFALWFKRIGRFVDHQMHWDSPWGDGFPGWHIECSAMSMKYLGNTIDIHTGGIDHLSIHHPNEIAQSECATGQQFVRFWIHHGFLMVEGEKMSKSKQNFYRIADVVTRGFNAMDLRYFYLMTHYRKQQNFTWQGIEAARRARERLIKLLSKLKQETTSARRTILSSEKLEKSRRYAQAFSQAIANDLNTPQALSVLWESVKSNIPSEDKYDLLMTFDEILGLKLAEYQNKKIDEIPQEIRDLVNKREQMRANKDYIQADTLRKQITSKGYEVEDISTGYRITKK